MVQEGLPEPAPRLLPIPTGALLFSTLAGSCFCLTAFLFPPTCHSFPAKRDSWANAGAVSRELRELGKGQEPQAGQCFLLSFKLADREQCLMVSLPDRRFLRLEKVPWPVWG